MPVLTSSGNTTTPDPPKDGWGLAPGEEIAPGLVAQKLLGGGRRYEAYLAYDESLLSTVVVKVLRPSKVDERSALAGLAEEYDTLRRCNHPSICRGFSAVVDGPRPHIVLEHVEGPRLSTLMRRFGRLDLDQLLALAVEVCAGLHYLHGRRMVHLDVKPSNIIMSAPPRLIDLSVACTFDDARALHSVVGTDAYMAPEQAAPTEGPPVGPAADLWGLGATLYEAIAGDLPYPRPSDNDRHPQRHITPRPLDATVPGEVGTAIMSCLAIDPADRPTPRELAAALEPLVAQLPRRIVLGRIRPRWAA